MKLFRRLNLAAGKAIFGHYWLAVSLFGLSLISPLLRWASVPCTHDGHLHYHRLTALRYGWENGLWFSRWLADVAYGYGYPFFNYREAAPLYLSLLPHLVGVPLPAAINLTYALGLLASGWFMFLWVRDLFGPAAATLAAVAYMAAPYQLVDALVRGNQPESLALVLFPLLLWSGRRFLVTGGAGVFLLATLSLALLGLSHNISILLFVPFLGIYLLWVGWLRRLAWSTVIFRIALVTGLGLGLVALYLGPALLELEEISISNSVVTRNNDFRFNFAQLEEIFAPVRPAISNLLNPPLLIRLGWLPSGLALFGLLSAARIKDREQRGHIVFMGLAAAVFLFMSLTVSRVFWDRLPLIEFVQFPWRFVGRAALPVAFLSGVPVFALSRPAATRSWPRWLAPAVTAGAALLLVVEALPALYPRVCSEEPWPTINTVHAYEHATGFVGVDPEGSYFPLTVQERPAGSPLEIDYQLGRPPQRFDESVMPEGTLIEWIDARPTAVQLVLDSPAAFQARYLSFAFPGWQATVDRQRVPISPGEPDGLITFPVPAGRHTVEVSWSLTPLRLAMTLISLASLVAVAAMAFVLARRKTGGNAALLAEHVAAPEASPTMAPFRRRSLFLALIIAAAAVLAIKLLLVDAGKTPLRAEALPEFSDPAGLSAGGLRLLGYNLSRDAVPSGETFDIDLAWLVDDRPTADLQSNVWLVGPEGLTWSDKETQRPRIYERPPPTNAWLPGQWAWDSREVQVLPGTPPGRYDIVLTLFDLANLQPLTLHGADGLVLGPTTVIGQVNVVRPENVHRPDTPPLLPYEVGIDKTIGGLTLLGYSQDRRQAAPGETVLLTLFWEKPAGGLSPADEFDLALLDGDGQTVQSWSIPPVRAGYRPAGWSPGERLRGQHIVRPAAGLDSGDYYFSISGVRLGRLEIVAPERLYSLPAFDTVAGVEFEKMIVLAGYTTEPEPSALPPTIPEPGQTLTLTLVWQGLEEIPVSYRVFVHLVDEDGALLDQSDAEPAGWLRPTTGWAPGEYVVDSHRLELPPGQATAGLVIRVGLYEAETGRRLEIGDGEWFQLPLGR